MAAKVWAEIAAVARCFPNGGSVMRKENEARTEVDGSTWGSLSTQMDQAHIKAERNGGLPQLGSVFIIWGQAHIKKE